MVTEEEFDVGRKIGVVARKNRALYETVKQVAKQKGKKMGDVLVEALELWHMYTTLESVDPKSLIAAMHFVEHMLERAVSLLIKLGSVFTSEFFRYNLTLLSEMSPKSETQTQEAKPQEAKLLKDQVKLTMLQAMLPMVMSIIQQLLTTITRTTSSGSMSIPIATQLATQSTVRTVKVED